MKCVTRKPSVGVGRFSKSIAGVCSVTILPSSDGSRTLSQADRSWMANVN
jgi:hypothetical protein